MKDKITNNKFFREKGDTKGIDAIYKIFGTKRNANLHFYAYILINIIYALSFITGNELFKSLASFVYLAACVILLSSFIYRYLRYKKNKKG
ncbi:MAG: hypothetical protein GX889_07930 [Clostridiales bacterium]|nr:hypothetical protein [Clostridiales bacterium]